MSKELQIDFVEDKNILVASLDWGLGHLTRTLVLCQKLIAQNNQIFLVLSKRQERLVSIQFLSSFRIIPLETYEVRWNANKMSYLQVLTQSPELLKMEKIDHSFVKEFTRSNSIDLVISDNRYGFYSDEVPSIIVSHQLTLQVPVLKNMVNRSVQKKMNRFNACWIPDHEQLNLTGDLVKHNLEIPVFKIGILSRFRKQNCVQDIDYFFLITGPNPESKRFEITIRSILEGKDMKYRIAGASLELEDEYNLNHPTTADLENLFNRSKTVVSKAGYTTIMDIVALEKNAILIPTPGQYEQEYLAKHIKLPYIQFIAENVLEQYLS